MRADVIGFTCDKKNCINRPDFDEDHEFTCAACKKRGYCYYIGREDLF